MDKIDLVLGVDLGTSSVKVGILDLTTLEMEHVAVREYDNSPEQDTHVLFAMTIDAIQESVSAIKTKQQISAIGLTGQMHGVVLYDQAGEIIHPLLNWQERVYSRDAVIAKMQDILGPLYLGDIGIDLSSGLAGTILFGIKQDNPDLFSRIDKFLLPVDFIRSKLLGRLDHATDPTNAFGTGLFNTRVSKWHDQVIRKLGLPIAIFPEVRNTSKVAGTLSDQVADIVGLRDMIPIILGGGDNQMSMLGSGLLSRSSPMLLNIGTGAQISLVTDEYIRVPGLDTRSYFENTFAFVGASLAGGRSYQWLKDLIKTESGFEFTYAEMDQQAAQVSPGADGLVFCPGPSRARPDREMGFFGNLRVRFNVGHQARAVMEGVIFDLYELYSGIRADHRSEIMVGSGKGLQYSKVWSQISADIFGKIIQITHFENALFGAALMAAFGTGMVSDMEGVLSTICYQQSVVPDPDRVINYQDEVFKNWCTVVNQG